jgi:uncharacterized protein (UPF0305 family)
MSMWFFDEAGELQDYQALRREARPLEREYLELRVLLRDAAAALKMKPQDEYLEAKVKYLARRCQDLEEKNPYLVAEFPIEVALFAPPHG